MDDDVAPSMGWPNFNEMDILLSNLDFKALFECPGWRYKGYVIKLKLSKTVCDISSESTHGLGVLY